MGAARWFVLQHVAYEGPGAVTDAIRRGGHTLEVIRIDRGEPVPTLDSVGGLAGLVVMGGPMSVHDEGLAWLHHERVLMKAAVDAGLPVLGVCLGAQQLAAALGGVVATGAEPEVGVGEVHLGPAALHDPVLGPVGSSLPCMHWHADTFTLPDGAVLLASSDLDPHQAFQFGQRAYGVQFHVEVTASLAGHWGPHLPPGVIVRAPDIAHIARAGQGVLDRFVALATAGEA
jgi:GMP synthase-like glutamine amidotransferase